MNKMARCGKENDHTKSGQLRRRRQYRIKHVMMINHHNWFVIASIIMTLANTVTSFQDIIKN